MNQITLEVPNSITIDTRKVKTLFIFLLNHSHYLNELIEDIGLTNAILENNPEPENYKPIDELKKEYANYLP